MNVYLGTFLIAFTTLAFEVTLARLLSVVTWYHLAFFAVSTAMLGMTAGATTVYVRPTWFTDEKLNANTARACLGYSLAIPIALVVLCLTPLGFYRSAMTLVTLIVVTFGASLPFYFSGIVVTVVLTKYQLPIGKLYASDLVGASLGCLFVLGGLEVLDAPSLILLCGAVGSLAAFSFGLGHGSFAARRASPVPNKPLDPWTPRKPPVWNGASIVVAIILTLSGLINAATSYGIRPLIVKQRIESRRDLLLERWNSFSRVVVQKETEESPQYWGASPIAPRNKIPQYEMNIDGEAGTTLRGFSSKKDIDHLRFDATNIAYYLRPKGPACVIGFGAGRDIQSAILFGHEKIVGIDVNPIFIDLLKGRFRKFAGIADYPGVSLVADEARSFLSRSPEKYSIIQMSLIDTWASTGAGAFSLSENALYTVEAWQILLDRLTDDGIFTVSRWYSPSNIGETGRVLSLAVASLLRMDVASPSEHIALITTDRVSTLLLSKQPLSKEDIERLRKVATDLQFDLVIVPGVPPANEALRAIISARSQKELKAAIANRPLNYDPPSDENPYFFNMLRLSHIRTALQSETGVVQGNLIATITLVGLIISLLILTVVTVILPLLIAGGYKRGQGASSGIIWSGALYFSLIGAGFMCLEIALIQRLSVFLGHPVYALGILLFTIIASAGCGSYLSERLPLAGQKTWIFALPITAALAIIAVRIVLTILVSHMITAPILNRIIVSILVIFPLGMLMGFFFPTGMKQVKSIVASETPWYWALNGIFGVLCSALAVFVSIYFGISTNLYISAACYAMTLICLHSMHRARLIQGAKG